MAQDLFKRLTYISDTSGFESHGVYAIILAASSLLFCVLEVRGAFHKMGGRLINHLKKKHGEKEAEVPGKWGGATFVAASKQASRVLL